MPVSRRSRKAIGGAVGAEHPPHLAADALLRDPADVARVGAHGGERDRLDGEIETSRDADGAQEPEGILVEALAGIAHRAHEPRAQVAPAVSGVDQAGGRCPGHGCPRRWR